MMISVLRLRKNMGKTEGLTAELLDVEHSHSGMGLTADKTDADCLAHH